MIYLSNFEQFEYVDEEIGVNVSYEFDVLHTHEYFEFFFTIHELDHFIFDKVEHIPQNHIAVIKPEYIHSIKAVKCENLKKNPTHLNLKISAKKLKEMLSAFDVQMFDKFLELPYKTYEVSLEVAARFKSVASTIMWCTDKNHKCMLIKTAIFEIVNLLRDEIYNETNSSKLDIPEVLKTVLMKMHTETLSTLKIDEIVSETNYSHMQISRLFKQYTGNTMKQYFTTLKLNNACSLLKNSEMSILDISTELGFDSMSHFDHIFKNKFGLTPRMYRRQKTIKTDMKKNRWLNSKDI